VSVLLGEAQAIVKTEHDNPCVMSVLQMLILKRMYMYDINHEDKHWAISKFDLGPSRTKLEFSKERSALSHHNNN
jgi:hypothetical protein